MLRCSLNWPLTTCVSACRLRVLSVDGASPSRAICTRTSGKSTSNLKTTHVLCVESFLLGGAGSEVIWHQCMMYMIIRTIQHPQRQRNSNITAATWLDISAMMRGALYIGILEGVDEIICIENVNYFNEFIKTAVASLFSCIPAIKCSVYRQRSWSCWLENKCI